MVAFGSVGAYARVGVYAKVGAYGSFKKLPSGLHSIKTILLGLMKSIPFYPISNLWPPLMIWK
jgi:hypothetical protein